MTTSALNYKKIDPRTEGIRVSASKADALEYVLFPGFCDVHVHFREPGFSYKETIYAASRAAAAGGYTDVCTMPNLKPVPDSAEHIALQQEIIDRDSVINIHPYASITINQDGTELSDMAALKDKCIAFSDDGKGIQDADLMRQAMTEARRLGKLIVAHCEVNSLLKGGYIHDGGYAKAHGHKGICSASEYEMIARDVELARETGCGYHVCHISTKESVDIIRRAKAEGVDVTCETAPHYLLMDDSFLREEGRFKMNPPLRDKSDRDALLAGLLDGTIDMIATDHAPHSAEEKSRGLAGSAFGITGIETAFPLLYTYLVKEGIISLDRLTELMAINPRKRFNIPYTDDYTVFELGGRTKIDSAKFISMGHSTPFDGWEAAARCMKTVCGSHTAYFREDNNE